MSQLALRGKTILVLGAYGFIGASVMRSLGAEGAEVRGFVRDRSAGVRILPNALLTEGDLRHFLRVEDWSAALSDVDIVVNCAGALQDGGGDDVERVHHTAIKPLGQACARRNIAVIQISAIGAEPEASTRFLRTKAAGDAALQASGVPLWIVKPGLVIGQTDYGGTALLRMLAAVPVVQPLAYPDTPVQCVGMCDLCQVVVSAAAEQLPQGIYDLVEDNPHTLAEVVRVTRAWLGFAPARFDLTVAPVLARGIACCAGFLGRFGWRSPLRSTAMTIMRQGVIGDPVSFRNASGRSLAALPEIYAAMPSAREHRLTARMTLLMPLVVGMLALFWFLSGLVGLFSLNRAAEVLTAAGWSRSLALPSVLFWSLVDMTLGLAVLVRPWAKTACLTQIGVAIAYLLMASLVVPHLWSDPLGPLVKILPVLVLSLVAIPMLETR